MCKVYRLFTRQNLEGSGDATRVARRNREPRLGGGIISSARRAGIWIFTLCWLIAFSTKPPVRAAQAAQDDGAALPQLSAAPALSTEGYFVLDWSAPADTPLILQQANSADFRAPLERPLAAAGSLTLTGFADGLYYFRAGPAGGPWSETVTVEIRHHPLGRALGFFSLGLALFTILGLTILLGHRREVEDGNAV